MPTTHYQGRPSPQPSTPKATSEDRTEYLPHDLDHTRDDIEYSLETAEDDILNGELRSAERILRSCAAECEQMGRPFDAYRLLIAIRLGDLYLRHKAWAHAVKQYQGAYQIWDCDEHIADKVGA